MQLSVTINALYLHKKIQRPYTLQRETKLAGNNDKRKPIIFYINAISTNRSGLSMLAVSVEDVHGPLHIFYLLFLSINSTNQWTRWFGMVLPHIKFYIIPIYWWTDDLQFIYYIFHSCTHSHTYERIFVLVFCFVFHLWHEVVHLLLFFGASDLFNLIYDVHSCYVTNKKKCISH